MTTDLKIIVLILYYNNVSWLEEAVAAVLADPFESKQLIFLDNGSEEQITDQVKKKFPNVPVHKVAINSGFDHGVSEGLKFALSYDPTHVLLLTSDVVLGKHAITELATSAKESFGKNVGVWGLAPIDYKDRQRIPFPPAAKIKNWLTFYRKPVFENQIRAGETFDYVTGIMMLSREVIESIGGFDDELFMYFEEMDYCLRARKAGFAISLACGAIYYYRSAEEEKTYKKANVYFSRRNEFFVHKKHAPGFYKPFFFLWYTSRLIVFALGALLKYRRLRGTTAPIYMYALRDILMQRRGIGSLNKVLKWTNATTPA